MELFVNYLLMGQGAVLGRAVSTLRSVEAHPATLNSSVFEFFLGFYIFILGFVLCVFFALGFFLLLFYFIFFSKSHVGSP